MKNVIGGPSFDSSPPPFVLKRARLIDAMRFTLTTDDNIPSHDPSNLCTEPLVQPSFLDGKLQTLRAKRTRVGRPKLILSARSLPSAV